MAYRISHLFVARTQDGQVADITDVADVETPAEELPSGIFVITRYVCIGDRVAEWVITDQDVSEEHYMGVIVPAMAKVHHTPLSHGVIDGHPANMIAG